MDSMKDKDANALSVVCPRCGQRSTLSKENRFRPFCSKRCQVLDLGAWASEGYRVEGEPAAGHQSLTNSEIEDEN